MVTQVSIGRTQTGGTPRAAWLAPSAAASLRRVDRALGRTLPVTWAGRTYAEQEKLWNDLGRNPAKVSPPGSSQHEKGMSIDTDDRPVSVLLEHGWKRTVKGEPWHFTYSTSRDNHLNDPSAAGGSTASTGGTAAPTPTPEEENDMAIFKSKAKDARIIIDDLGADNIGDFKPTQLGDDNATLITATRAVYGEHQVIEQAHLDVAAQFARNRWEAKKAEIIAGVVAEIKKLL